MSNLPALQQWALPKLEKILPFDRETLGQIIKAAATEYGGPTGAGEYLQELLGFGEDALEFISGFTERMQQQQQQSQSQKQPAWSVNESVPAYNRRLPGAGRGKVVAGGFKKEVRRVDDGAEGLKVYRKKDEEDEYWGSGSGAGGSKNNNNKPGSGATTPQRMGITPTGTPPPQIEKPPTPVGGGKGGKKQQQQQGTLTSDLLAPSAGKSKNNHGIKMTANSSTMRAPGSGPLSDIESALRTLELSTNPTHTDGRKRPSCNCLATIHDLFLAAPNCLSCGKVICIKEGPGPCTFCGTPLLSSEETQQMISFLREERGREKMEAGNKAQKKAEVARVHKPYHAPATDAAALARAKSHRDKLLGFQTNNAQRTKIIDEAADFDTSAVESGGFSGLSAWASPQERALQLKKQQKRMREVEFAAKDGWEKRKVVVSLDISGSGKGGKPVITSRREMREVGIDEVDIDEADVVDVRGRGRIGEDVGEASASAGGGGGGKQGKYARNPLLKGYIKPVYTPPTGASSTKKKPPVNKSMKGKAAANDDYGYDRNNDDDLDLNNNEKWILDGGVGGAGPETGMTAQSDEPKCG
ncbi:hypothetical protein DFH27DRAFT_476330 [Peziza echinospora]|nr:hypothetical protein DFH27DRAFT_476330 [Peziza echinospora]